MIRRLILYPCGNKKDGGKNHVSIYVRLETSISDISKNWEIHVDLKYFFIDQNKKKYLTVQGKQKESLLLHTHIISLCWIDTLILK